MEAGEGCLKNWYQLALKWDEAPLWDVQGLGNGCVPPAGERWDAHEVQGDLWEGE